MNTTAETAHISPHGFHGTIDVPDSPYSVRYSAVDISGGRSFGYKFGTVYTLMNDEREVFTISQEGGWNLVETRGSVKSQTVWDDEGKFAERFTESAYEKTEQEALRWGMDQAALLQSYIDSLMAKRDRVRLTKIDISNLREIEQELQSKVDRANRIARSVGNFGGDYKAEEELDAIRDKIRKKQSRLREREKSVAEAWDRGEMMVATQEIR